jgi:hypothetical protein
MNPEICLVWGITGKSDSLLGVFDKRVKAIGFKQSYHNNEGYHQIIVTSVTINEYHIDGEAEIYSGDEEINDAELASFETDQYLEQ